MKKHQLVLTVLFSLILPLTLFSPAYLSVVRGVTCSTQTGTTPAVPPMTTADVGDTVTLSVPGASIVRLTLPGVGVVSGTTSASGTATSAGPIFWGIGGLANFSWSFTICKAGAGSSTNNPPIPPFNDGRINMWDAHETSAIYCQGDGSVRVYVPADPKWRVAFDTSPAELASVPKNPAQNTVIKSGNGATLLRLQNGSLQVDTPALEPSKGLYSFIFQDCPVPPNQSNSGQPSGKPGPGVQFGAGMNLGGFGQ